MASVKESGMRPALRARATKSPSRLPAPELSATLPAMNDNLSEDSDLLHPHRWYMRKALRLAERAAASGEVPVGAVIVRDGHVIAQAYNQVELLKDATAHAEMIALTQAASAVGDWRLTNCVLYVTKEPCPMCAGAIVLSRISQVVWGLSDPLRGGAVSRFNILQSDTLNHRVDIITGVLEDECRSIIQDFFRSRRNLVEPSDSGIQPAD